MKRFLNRLFGHRQDTHPRPEDEESTLTQFYTNTLYALEVFEQLARETGWPKRLLVIHGIGGVGKSSLLKMYLLACRRHHLPAAFIASEEAASPVDVLADWAEDLSHGGVPLSTFQKTLGLYRAIQARVEVEAKKSHSPQSQLAGELGKTTVSTAISMAASAIPIIGPLVGALGGKSAEAFIDWLRGFLSKPDMDFYLDPAKRLDSDFLSDLARIADRRRLVLVVDTYERMTVLDEWMRELARRLPRNVLLIIASRTVPAWERAWQGWMGQAQIIELVEMTSDDLRALVHHYYTYIRGGTPDPRQVEAIVEFARGLPIVATTVVQLWIKYGIEDFHAVRPQVIADLVDRLLEGVPQEIQPAFEAAALFRYFNVDALSAVLENSKPEQVYAELRRWPFTRSRKEGLAIHDTMREMINEAMRVRTPERFRTLHERAAAYYKSKLEKATGDEWERCILERLYHRVQADEVSGMQLFQEIAEELTRYRLFNRLRALLNDSNTYPLEQENGRLWRDYYAARLEDIGAQRSHAEKVYRTIGENRQAEPKLRAYALCDWGIILRRPERIYQPGGVEKAVHALEVCLNLGVTIDLKLAMSWAYLSDVYTAISNWERALSYLEQPRQFFSERNDYAGLLTVLDFERRNHWNGGSLRKAFDVEESMRNMYIAAGQPPYLRMRFFPIWEKLWAGRYAETEQEYRVVIEIARSLQDQESLSRRSRDMAFCLGLQGKCAEALELAEEGLTLAHSFGSGSELNVFHALTIYGIIGLKCGQLSKAQKYLTEAIALGQKMHTYLGAAPIYLANIYEMLQLFDKAEDLYRLLRAEAHVFVQEYHKCAALSGLVRIKQAQKDYATLVPLWTESERVAQQYEYNDLLASLHLTRGHLTWDGLIAEWEDGFDAALHHYQYALISALRFNRFLLDEVLAGQEQETPLHSIIVHCIEQKREGQRMLMTLRDWWQTGFNDVERPRPDTVSPLSEDISLLEAERLARQREPGNNAVQMDVITRINSTPIMAHDG